MRLLAPQPLFALLLALVPAFQTAPVQATPEPTPSELSVARRLFEEGRAAQDAARWREAAEKFRKAIAIKDTPGMRFHLARCQEEQGAFVEALVEYDRARELLDSGVRAADVEKLLPEARERVRAKVALLTVRLPSGVESVSVELDGKALSSSVLGVPMPLDPGVHRVEAVAVGRQPFAKDLALQTGEVRQLLLELPVATTVPQARPAPVVATARAVDAHSETDALPARTIVLVGEASLFVAALGTGIGFSVARGAANDRYEAANRTVLAPLGGSDPEGTACSLPREGCADLEEAAQDRSRAGTLAVASFVGAGASAAAFGLTYWLWPAGRAPADVKAAVAPGHVELSFSGRF